MISHIIHTDVPRTTTLQFKLLSLTAHNKGVFSINKTSENRINYVGY